MQLLFSPFSSLEKKRKRLNICGMVDPTRVPLGLIWSPLPFETENLVLHYILGNDNTIDNKAKGSLITAEERKNKTENISAYREQGKERQIDFFEK
jgi:hypothetical protein